MVYFKRISIITAVLLCVCATQSYDNAYAWEDFARTNTLFAVGEVDAGRSYLYTIDPLSGELHMIGDTGLNNCRGLDFTPDGRLMTFCELRDEEGVTPKGLDPLPGVAAQLNINNGLASWAVLHGVSNSMSDIAIRADSAIFSIENVDSVNLHTHVEENDFQADFISETGIDSLDHAIAFWGADDLKMAANVDSPKLYTIDTKTGSTLLVDTLLFPGILTTAANSVSPREIRLEEIHFGSMDKVNFASVFGAGAKEAQAVSTKGALHAFNETDAEFAVHLFQATGQAEVGGESVRIIDDSVWAAIGLMDSDTAQVDFIVEIQVGALVRAIAVKERKPNPIPTMSEWGLIITASALFALALVVLVRRKKAALV